MSSFGIEGCLWSMAAPPQLRDVNVKVETQENKKPHCLVDMTVVNNLEKDQIENISLELSPEAITAAVESLSKVRAQLDSIAKKTKA